MRIFGPSGVETAAVDLLKALGVRGSLWEEERVSETLVLQKKEVPILKQMNGVR